MATTTVATGRKTIKDTTAADIVNISGDATAVTIAGKMTAGDIINIEGLASEYTVSASGRTITLKSATQTIKFQLAATNGSASVRFLDGDLLATHANAKAGATLGGVKLTKKPMDIDDSKLGTTDSASVDFTGGATTGGSTGGSTGGGSTAGTTYTLTTELNDFIGTSGNDTFNAGNATTNAAGQTFTVGDTLNGGAGTDTLNVTVGAANTYAMSNVSAIEKVNATFTAAGTLSLLGATGVTEVSSNGSTAAAIFTNIGSTSVGLGLKNSDQAATYTFTTAAVAGGADTATLTVSGANQATTVATTIADVETLNIVSAADSTIGLLTAAAATSINVSGAGALTIVDNLAVATTIDASKTTAGVDLDFGVGAVTVTGGTGNDTLSFEAAGAVSVVGGDGNDTFIFDATGTVTTADSIAGGGGTDTLRVATSANLTGYTAPATATISGIENLNFDAALGANLTTANIQAGIERVNLAAGAGGFTITMDAGSRTIGFSAAAAAATVVADTGTALTDSLTLLNTSAATDVYDAKALTVTGFETVTANTSTTTTRVSNDFGAIGITPDSGGSVTLKFVGNNAVTTGVITATSATSATVDASGLTGAANFSTGANATVGVTNIIGSANADTIASSSTATTVDGGAGNDSLTGGAANDVISGSAGDDTVDGAAGNDSISGGDGADSLTAGAGNDTLLGGSGNDTFVFAANLASNDSIDGGDGTDSLSITAAVLGTLNGYSIATIAALNNRISGIENVTISDTFNLGAAFDMTRLDGITGITLADGITGDEEISGLASGSTVVVNADNAADTNILTLTLADNTGASDVLNYTMTQGADDDYGVLAIAGAETVNLTINEATASATVRVGTLGLTLTSDGTTTRAITLNVAGTETLTIDTAVAANTINTTGLSGNFIMTNTTGSSLAQTITTGDGDDTIYGGGGADTINAGAGGDSIVGGTGVDVITAGLGADVVNGGAGNDSINLTEGAASTDTVEVDYSGVRTEVDTITGFTTGSTNGDQIDLDLSALETAGTSGIHASASDFTLLGDGATGVADADAVVVEAITGATTVGATTNVLAIRGTIASAADLEDALELGGAFALTTDGAFDAGDAFIVVYTDGSKAYVAAVRSTAGDTGAGNTFAVGDLVAANLVELAGVSSIGATTFVAANFDWIA